jgi:radical SAM-linked protein
MRVRITFSKQGALRYTGHLDLHKILERSLRRARLPLVYSQGYHPQPRINLAAALPLGFASRAEVMDIWLNGEVDDVVSPLQANVPPGLTILKAECVDEREPSLQSRVIAAEYQVEIEGVLSPEPTRPGRAERAGAKGQSPSSSSGLKEKIASVMASDSLPRERRGKQYDLRPLIEELTPLSLNGSPKGVLRAGAGDEGQGLFMRLTAREGATGRPEEVLDVLGIPLEATRIERTRLIFKG